MRQVGDSLVWLAMIAVFAAVLYFTPRVAHYIHVMSDEHGRDCMTCHGFSHQQSEVSNPIP